MNFSPRATSKPRCYCRSADYIGCRKGGGQRGWSQAGVMEVTKAVASGQQAGGGSQESGVSANPNRRGRLGRRGNSTQPYLYLPIPCVLRVLCGLYVFGSLQV